MPTVYVAAKKAALHLLDSLSLICNLDGADRKNQKSFQPSKKTRFNSRFIFSLDPIS